MQRRAAFHGSFRDLHEERAFLGVLKRAAQAADCSAGDAFDLVVDDRCANRTD